MAAILCLLRRSCKYFQRPRRQWTCRKRRQWQRPLPCKYFQWLSRRPEFQSDQFIQSAISNRQRQFGFHPNFAAFASPDGRCFGFARRSQSVARTRVAFGARPSRARPSGRASRPVGFAAPVSRRTRPRILRFHAQANGARVHLRNSPRRYLSARKHRTFAPDDAAPNRRSSAQHLLPLDWRAIHAHRRFARA